MNNETTHRTGLVPVLCFLSITFVATYAVEFAFITDGIRFDDDVMQSAPALWLLGVMWIPGLAALFTALAVEKCTFRGLVDSLSLRLGSVGPYFLTLFIAPLAFAVMYGISWLLGLTSPDMTMTALSKAVGGNEPITPEMVFQVMLPLSVFLGPIFNFIFGLGEEIGWRGFLLPRLMGLGRANAYLILGVIWGLWHAPLVWAGFNYPGHPVAGIAMMCALSTAFGLFINEMTLHYRSTLLAAFIHGAVNAQGYGIWLWLFPGTNPLLGGGTGIVAVVVWLAFGLLTATILSRLSQSG